MYMRNIRIGQALKWLKPPCQKKKIGPAKEESEHSMFPPTKFKIISVSCGDIELVRRNH